MNETARFRITWQGYGRKAENPPDPRHPGGVVVDGAAGRTPACRLDLPYPAPEVGRWLLVCRLCGWTGIVTAAGRADDPRGVVAPCKPVRH